MAGPPTDGRTGKSSVKHRRPASDESSKGSKVLEQGARIDRYVLLKVVGQGGMGTVYAAYDPELDRKVALKLLRPGKGDAEDSEGRARLLREAQAMARISHPNVITVHDVGTFGSQVFITLEFIQGQTLREWLRKDRHPWQQILQRFLEAGQGLVAAHQAGLVHRDFKPANVLISDSGRVYVTDFGLARLAEAAGQEEAAFDAGGVFEEQMSAALSSPLTSEGVIVGTPQYMPPEQYLGNAGDARLDQFSFCASLYWALYGKRPFEPQQMAAMAAEVSQSLQAQSPQEIRRRLGHGTIVQDPPRDTRVPSWVRRAVLRGLSLAPEDRFPSMQALLTALSQQQRRVRRRKVIAAVGAVAVAGAGVGLYFQHRSQLCTGAESLMASVWGPAPRQKLEAAFSATGKPFAPESARRVVQELDGYAQGWARMHTEACVATRIQGMQTEALLSLRMVCLDRRRRDLRALVGLLTEADGKVVERSVDAVAALPSLKACQDIESLTEQSPLPEDPARRATIERLGEQLSQIKALHDAGRYQAALTLARTIEPEVVATTYLPLQAELRYHLGWLLQQSGEAEEGLRELERAFDDAESSRSDRTRLEVLIKLIFTLATNGHPEQAQRWGEVAVAVLNRLGGEPSLAGDLMGNLGSVALMQGRYQEATGYFEKARALQLDPLGREDPKQAKVSYGLGLAALRQGEHARAIQMLGEALQQTQSAKGAQHPEMGSRHVMLATAYRESGDPVQALAHAESALKLRKAALGANHPAVADALDEMGECLLLMKRYEEAMEAFRKAVDIKGEKLGMDHPDLSYSYDGMGKALLAWGRAEEAIAYLKQALAYENTEPEALAETGFRLAQALWETGKAPQGAREEAIRAREGYAKLEKPQQVAEITAWLKAREAPPSPAHSVRPPRRQRR
ncbi:tetratricopeptide repeat protein [Stigmatella sp. ncwal1]|uniref:Tetratricopeptide repeat protein n=1 Tax=Stigmatella ashevillensis TaxID=2995309 RepID=A0ABT5DLP5_9BACT|nr:tetratricopeptide repeat protein [Stigmatella ashevillena]MDC0713949.1 tetratricopeptide repeat protein [Stigmatella ashevillena]